MEEPIREEPNVSGPIRTTVFKSGNSQAVRIPAALRIASGAVSIEAVPEGLLLRPEEEDFGLVVARLREFQKEHNLEQGLIEEIEDLPLDEVPNLDHSPDHGG